MTFLWEQDMVKRSHEFENSDSKLALTCTLDANRP